MSARVFVSASVQRQELLQDSLLLIAGFICGLKTQTFPPTKALPTRCGAVVRVV